MRAAQWLYYLEEGGEAGATEVLRTSCGLGRMNGTRTAQDLYYSGGGSRHERHA